MNIRLSVVVVKIFKILLLMLAFSSSVDACPPFKTLVPIADVYVEIDAQEIKTSFDITWKFKKDFVNSLSEHDKNHNGIFDKDEQEDIKHEYLAHLEENNYITEIVYVKKGKRIKKSLILKIKLKESKLIFADGEMTYRYSFDTDFIIKKDHRMFIRFLDPTQKVNIELKEIKVNNYTGEKVILPQDIRANIYFYKHTIKSMKYKL